MSSEYDYSRILNEINEAGLLEGALREDDCNTIPYGSPTDCRPVLVALVDGKAPVAEVITSSLMHVGQTCRSITRTVIFYIQIPHNEWTKTWALFQPSFDQLQQQGLAVHVQIEQPAPAPARLSSFPFQDDGTPISGPCESCKNKPATTKRMDTWTFQTVFMCDECAERFF